MNVSRTILVGVCALVIGIYAYMARPGVWESINRNAADGQYNLLVQAFRAGQLNLKKEVPPGLARLADPYDPSANAPYLFAPHWMLDFSYYKGRLFLYWGLTPALILFWPLVALTGEYLSQPQAVTIFCAAGFLASVCLLRAVWRRHFAEVNAWVLAAGALALGLTTVVPVMLTRSACYEVAISCGYMLTMLALGGIWRALHDAERGWRWLAAASLAYGLAVGARPSLLFGGVVLLVPVAAAWRGRRQIWALLMAAIIPITMIGSGLMLYNMMRFDSPFEFGEHYQLSAIHSSTWQYFRLRYLWFNLRVYFLEPVRWGRHFPFVQNIVAPPLPSGHYEVEGAFGVLTNIPLVWLALAVPLAWRSRSGQEASTMRWFVTAVALLVVAGALTIGTFFAASMRYEVDFLPALLLLAAIGILGLERALADRPVWRRIARSTWGALLVFSVAVNILTSIPVYANERWGVGVILAQEGRMPEAIQIFKEALRLKPDFPGVRVSLGSALLQTGKVRDAIEQYEEALRLDPNYAVAHANLANALLQLGNIQEAVAHCEQALGINPNYADAHVNLGSAFVRMGRIPEAAREYETALRINPQLAEAHSNLGAIYQRTGKLPEAIAEYEDALQITPDYPEAHFNLGLALEKLGRTPEAIEHYQQAAKLRPDFTPATKALARLGAGP